jgi:hypothetical protein
MLRVIVAAALIILTSHSASAQTTKQKNVINNVGRILAAEKACPQLEADKFVLASAIYFHGIKSEELALGGRYNALLVSAYHEAANAYEAAESESIACATAMVLYGPNGVNAKGLLRLKN